MPLAESFILEAAAGQPPLTLAADAAERLRAHRWPGNIRELRNVIMRSVLFCRDGVLSASSLRMGPIETTDPFDTYALGANIAVAIVDNPDARFIAILRWMPFLNGPIFTESPQRRTLSAASRTFRKMSSR